ncbi:18158_t:CDS:10 [Acaulospora morrowiae]|uniref:Probable enoyl-CoA hydratase, mitochondrial n=1 Tax=Acaulospora morrowiae TaxID=94023 RepID=A0A9N8VQ09_9GLOM|nr:18158_t:CDS:10 [Acaulospora morrowiae]
MRFTIVLAMTLVVLVANALGSEVINLEQKTFDQSVSKGRWFVEFYAPWCVHCQELEPTWNQLANEQGDFLKKKNFYIAKVDCTLHGDICEKNGVKNFPSLFLYNNGNKLDMYSGSRTLDSLTEFTKTKAVELYEKDTGEVIALGEETSGGSVPQNPLGTVVPLTGKNFDELVSSGPWFIKFFAPWCGHCQHLAPTWEKLGKSLKDKLNVGEVDCTIDGDLCKKYKILGYPTLKLFQSPDDIVDYKGSRQLQNLLDFAERAGAARISEINSEELDEAKETDDVLFIYLYDESTPLEFLRTMKTLSRSFFSLKFYSSKDKNLAKVLKVESTPALIVLKDDMQKTYPAKSPDDFTNLDALRKWIRSEKYPLVPEMDSENYEDILSGDRLVVLGVLQPNEVENFTRNKESLKKAAKIHQQTKKDGGSDDDRSIMFAWLNGNRWTDYIYNVYGKSIKDIPVVLIVDLKSSEYYDATKTGEKISFESNQLLETIYDAKEKHLIGKKSHKETKPHYHHILTESHDKVGLITLNRPKALNALSSDMFHEINEALEKFDNDPNIGAIVIAGNERAFAGKYIMPPGADITEMRGKTYAQVYKSNFLSNWGKINDVKKPTIAAVNGFALGGGCELAMSCDIIYAGENAAFGQPEIKLGIIPGAGGTQRLTRAIGKSKAMEIVLTGKKFTAQDAEKWGLVSKVLPVDKVLEEAIKLGQEIASLSQPSVQAAKEAVNNAFELSLKEGNHFERRLFYSLFSLADKEEGISAFLDKREPIWKNE